MSISVDWPSRIIHSDASITDIVAFKDALRNLEFGNPGILFPITITFKQIDVGGGAFFYAVDVINDYRLKFPPGSYVINGNINGEIVPDPGVYVERIKALAFATTSGSGATSGGGLTTAQDAKLSTILVYSRKAAFEDDLKLTPR